MRAKPEQDWESVEVPHLRIIEDELWFKVQERLGIHGSAGGRKNRVSKRRLLGGLLKCGVCGSGMTVNGGGDGRSRILCSRHRESASCSHKRSYYLDTVETIVVQVLRQALLEPDSIHTFVETYITERRKLNAATAKQYDRAKAELQKAQAALDRGIDALIDGRISKEEWARRRPVLDERVGQAERELALCKSPQKLDLHPEALRQYRSAVDSLHDLLGKADAVDEKLSETFRALVHSVIIHEVPPKAPLKVEIYGKLSVLLGEPVCKLVVAGACNKQFSPSSFVRLVA